MLVKAGVVASTWAYEAGVVEEMDGVAVVWRTRLTSLKASSDHRSTFRTYMVCSISLDEVISTEPASTRETSPGYLLAVDLLASSCISDH